MSKNSTQRQQIKPSHNMSLRSRRAEKDGIGIEEHNLYTGPIPPPELMKGFAEVDPSFPQRLLALAERENAFRQSEAIKNNKVMRAEIRSDGIVRLVVPLLAFIMVMADLYLAYFAFSKGLEWGAAVVGLPGLGIIVAVFTRFSRYRTK